MNAYRIDSDETECLSFLMNLSCQIRNDTGSFFYSLFPILIYNVFCS